MSNPWLIYGFPAVSLLLAAGAILLARHSAAEFDRKYGDKLHPGE